MFTPRRFDPRMPAFATSSYGRGSVGELVLCSLSSSLKEALELLEGDLLLGVEIWATNVLEKRRSELLE